MMNRAIPFALILALGVQPALAQPGPGRCSGDMNPAKLDAGDLADRLLPYTRCLTNAKQRYGFNDGPFAVAQCAGTRRSVATSLPESTMDRGERLMDGMDKAFVWQVWCSTDVGSELPTDVRIKADWPQAQWNTNAPNH